VQRKGIGIGHGMNSRFKGAQSGRRRGNGVLGDTCGGPEERAVFLKKGGRQRENACQTARRCAGGEAREGCRSKRECTRSQARALSPNFIRRMPYLPLCSRRATGTRRKVCDYVNMISMCVKQFARATGSRVPDDSHAQQWARGHVTTPTGFFLTDAGHAKTALECSEPH
jgi:hypothetical protein